MRFPIFILLPAGLIGICAGVTPYYGVPVYLDQNTNTIETYNPAMASPIRSHSHGDAFANNLKANLNSYYPSVTVSRTDRRDASVTYSTLVNDGFMNNYEMVFFSGHGWVASSPGVYTGKAPGFATYEQSSLKPGSRSYGGWTRWVFADFCQFLINHDPNFYRPMFNGLHAVFGYESDMWYYINPYNCYCFGGCCSHHRSETKYENFAAKWARPNNKGLWDSWSEANLDIQYAQGGFGNAPAAVYNVVSGWQGATVFMGHQERVANTWNGDVPVSQLRFIYSIYGTPTY
ncbi:MAG: hypothetical protein JWP91_312 [Fibrobacteres bacterium]|nr:hypothetical protein [Fibrobacterota bacterium]